MTINSGMRPIRRRVPASIEDGGTGARTVPEAVAALGVPSLDGDNTFTGGNQFAGRFNVRLISHESDLTLGSVDGVRIGQNGGTGFYSLLDPSLLTANQYAAFPDKSGTLALTGDPVQAPYKAQGSVYTASSTDCVIKCTGTWTLTLPTAVGVSGKFYFIKNSGVGTITMAGTGGQTFDGVASPTVAAGASLTVCSDGANWLVL